MIQVLLADSVWNSLEVTKLAVSALTPIVVLVLGLWVRRSLQAVETAQWFTQRHIEWKIQIYEEIAPMINDLYSFMTYRGSFKEKDPPSVIRIKRDLDRRAEIVAPVLGPEFLTAYKAFMDLCFKTYTGKNRDARLRTGFESRKDSWGTEWQVAWEQLFVNEESEKADRTEVGAAYERLMQVLASDLNLTRQAPGPCPEKSRQPGAQA